MTLMGVISTLFFAIQKHSKIYSKTGEEHISIGPAVTVASYSVPGFFVTSLVRPQNL